MDDSTTTILKWVRTVLLAGFIAQFGKMFAEYLVKHRKKRKKADEKPVTTGTGVSPEAEAEKENKDKSEKERQKLLKKQKKAEYKKLKKM